jgi:hypothetical protein
LTPTKSEKMIEEKTVDESVPEIETNEEITITNKDVREHKLFRGIAKELNETKAKLKEFEELKDNTLKSLELEKAKSTQTLEQLVSQKDLEVKKFKEMYESSKIDYEIKLQASKLGIHSDIILEGLISKYKKDAPESMNEWLNAIIETEQFGKSVPTNVEKLSPGPSGRAVSRSGYDLLIDKAKKGDAVAVAEVKRLISEGKIK